MLIWKQYSLHPSSLLCFTRSFTLERKQFLLVLYKVIGCTLLKGEWAILNLRNNSAAEGCIDEGCFTEENLTNCSRYFEDGDIETRFNRPRRNDDESEINASSESAILSNLFPALGKPIGAIKTLSISSLENIQAHRYVLTNCELVDVFREKFRIEVTRMHRGKRNSSKFVEGYVHKHFHEWFKKFVQKKQMNHLYLQLMLEWCTMLMIQLEKIGVVFVI